MDFDILAKAYAGYSQNKKFAFATVVKSTVKGTPRKVGAKMVVFEDGSSFGSIGGGRYELDCQRRCLKAIASAQTETVTYDYFGQKGQSICGGQIHVLIEPVVKPRHFILCGAGHIALPLSFIVKMLNYKLTVIDNRRSFANTKRFAHADKILVGKHARQLAKIKLDAQSHVMIVTQGNEFDYECLRAVVESEAGYIGVISSKAKRIKFFKRLREDGISEKYLRRISIPAGLDLGGELPAEIAVSIASELVSLNNKETTKSAKFIEKAKAKSGK